MCIQCLIGRHRWQNYKPEENKNSISLATSIWQLQWLAIYCHSNHHYLQRIKWSNVDLWFTLIYTTAYENYKCRTPRFVCAHVRFLLRQSHIHDHIHSKVGMSVTYTQLKYYIVWIILWRVYALIDIIHGNVYYISDAPNGQFYTSNIR